MARRAALQKRVLPIFGDVTHAGKGSDAGIDPHHAQTDWLIAENAVYPHRDIVSKRTGTTRSTDTYNATQMVGVEGGPALYGDGTYGRYDPEADTAHYSYISQVDKVTTSIDQIDLTDASSADDVRLDIMDIGSYIALAHRRKLLGSAYHDTLLSVYDKQSLERIARSTLLTSNTFWPVFRFVRASSSQHNLYYVDQAAGAIKYVTVDATTGQISSATSITLGTPYYNSNHYQYMDACLVGSDVFIILAESGAFRVIKQANGTGTGTSSISIGVAGGSGVTTLCTCWAVGSDRVGIAYGYTNGGTHYLDARVLTTSLAIDFSLTSLDTLTAASDDYLSVAGIDREGRDTGAYDYSSTILWTRQAVPAGSTQPSPLIEHCVFYESGGIGAKLTTRQGKYRCRIWTKPFPLSGADNYVFGVYSQEWDTGTATVDDDSFEQGQCFLLNDGDEVVGRALPGRARTGPQMLASLHDAQSSGNPWTVSAKTLSAVEDERYTETRAITSMEINLFAKVVGLYDRGNVLIPGSCPFFSDGRLYAPQGLLQYPSPIDATIWASGLGNMSAGVYQIVAVYERIDSRGRIFRSAPTPEPAQYTVSSNEEIQVRVPNLPFGYADEEDYRVAIYRTEVNGSTFFRDVVEDIIPNSAHYDDIIVGQTADADLSNNEVLYTDQDILESQPPPPHTIATSHQNRLVCVPSESPKDQLRYSQLIDSASQPTFHENLRIDVPADGGAITALISHLDRLIVGKENLIYAIEGEGAAPNGSGALWSRGYIVSPSVGIKDFRSVVQYPNGWFFSSSDDSIWSLNNGLQLSPVGHRQRYYTDTYGPVLGAATLPGKHYVVFALDGANSPLLVYDWLHDKWSQFTTQTDTVAICAVEDVLYRLDSSGYIWVDDDTSYRDDNGTTEYWIPLHLRTGFVHKGASPDGWQRVSDVIASGYNHGDGCWITASLAYNGEPYFVDSKKINTSSLAAFDHTAAYGIGSSGYEGESLALRIQPSGRKQKCSSIMVDLVDSENEVTSGQGYSLTSLSLRVGLKSGAKRVGRARHLVTDA